MFIGNSTIKNSLKSVNIWQIYKQGHGCLGLYFVCLANTLLKMKNARDNHVLACNFPKIFTNLKKFTE